MSARSSGRTDTTPCSEGSVDGGGTVRGGGAYDEDAPGHVASSNLRYVIVH